MTVYDEHYRGTTPRFQATFEDVTGSLVNASGLYATIEDPNGTVAGSITNPTASGTGTYYWEPQIPTNGSLGFWRITWAGSVNNLPVAKQEVFRVIEAKQQPGIDKLVHKVRDRIPNIDSNVTDAMIRGYLEDAAKDIENYTGTAINTTTIENKYEPILIHLGCANLRSYMTGVGIDFNITQGEFTISKGQESNMHAQQLQYHLDRAMTSLKKIGRPIRYTKVNG